MFIKRFILNYEYIFIIYQKILESILLKTFLGGKMRGRRFGQSSFLFKQLFKTVNHSVHVGGQVTVNSKKCNLCGRCEKICPVRAIKGDKEKRKWRIFTNCRHCYVCVSACPNKAMRIL